MLKEKLWQIIPKTQLTDEGGHTKQEISNADRAGLG
jgi:hypothetical protein